MGWALQLGVIMANIRTERGYEITVDSVPDGDHEIAFCLSSGDFRSSSVNGYLGARDAVALATALVAPFGGTVSAPAVVSPSISEDRIRAIVREVMRERFED